MPPTFRSMKFRPIEFAEYLSPDGKKFRFENHYRFLISEEGYGMPRLDYISQKAPLQHGETVYDYRLQPRIIQIIVREDACERIGYWDARANLLNVIRPNRQYVNQFELGVLRKILPDGNQRDIRAIIQEGPSFPAGERGRWDERSITETLRFICPDPTFYDPIQSVNTWISSSIEHLILPFVFDGVDMIFAEDTSGAAISIVYTGTWLSYPTITIVGPITAPVITNLETGDVIDLSAYTVAAGEVVTIDLAFGNKTVTSSLNGNIIRYVGSASDLATFAIVPDPTAPGGVNNIRMSGSGIGAGLTSLSVAYYTRYIAI